MDIYIPDTPEERDFMRLPLRQMLLRSHDGCRKSFGKGWAGHTCNLHTTCYGFKTFQYNDTSGCGGALGAICEEQIPYIKFVPVASNLAEGNHTLELVNNAYGPAQTGVALEEQ